MYDSDIVHRICWCWPSHL